MLTRWLSVSWKGNDEDISFQEQRVGKGHHHCRKEAGKEGVQRVRQEEPFWSHEVQEMRHGLA